MRISKALLVHCLLLVTFQCPFAFAEKEQLEALPEATTLDSMSLEDDTLVEVPGGTSIKVYTDTSLREGKYGSSLKVGYELAKVEGSLRTFHFEDSQGKRVDAHGLVLVTVYLDSELDPAEADVALNDLWDVIRESYPRASKVMVVPMVDPDAPAALQEVAAVKRMSGILDENGPPKTSAITQGFSHRISFTLRKIGSYLYNNGIKATATSLHWRTTQLFLVGVACAAVKSTISYKYWTGSLPPDTDLMFMALLASWPQDLAYGVFPGFMQRIYNEWPSLVGRALVGAGQWTGVTWLKNSMVEFKKRFLDPVSVEFAATTLGIVNGIVNGVWFRTVVYNFQQRHIDDIPFADRVQSAFSSEFAWNFLITGPGGIIPGTLAGTAVRTARMRGQINLWVENALYQMMGFEMQWTGIMLAAFPSWVPYYAAVSSIVKVSAYAIVRNLPAKQNRILFLVGKFSEKSKNEIFAREGVEAAQVHEIPRPQLFDPDFRAVTLKQEDIPALKPSDFFRGMYQTCKGLFVRGEKR